MHSGLTKTQVGKKLNTIYNHCSVPYLPCQLVQQCVNKGSVKLMLCVVPLSGAP